MNLGELLDFFDPPITIGFDVVPTAAIDYLKSKGLKTTFSYLDAAAEEHAVSFTIAKMMDTDLLADVQASLATALENGTPFKEWADTILPTLQAKGWVGRKAMVDPLTGQTVVAALGTPHRLETIFRTNMQSAYAVGAWEQIAQQAEQAPFLMYDAIDDFRTRPEHAARDGEIHPVGSQFWKVYYPPCDYNCRCSAIQLSQDELDELGLSVSPPAKIEYHDWTNPRTGKTQKVPKGVGPGFGYNVGQARIEELAKLAVEKAKALPPDLAKAAMQGLEATHKAMDATASQAARNVLRQAAKRGADLAAAGKAAERAAAAQIQKALTEKTPHLAKAIQQVQATKAGQAMSSTELLAVAKEKALKLEASTTLNNYKQAKLAGKTPNAKQQAAFDALPDEAQEAISQQIELQLAENKLQAAAKAELASIAEKPNSIAGKALAKVDQTGKKPSEVLAEVKAAETAAKTKQVTAQGVAGYKKALATGKTPTPAQKAAFEALSPAEQAKLLQEADAAKAKPVAPTKTADAIPADRYSERAPLDPDSLTQTGPQGGSNIGGEFTDTSTGIRWYVKYPDATEAVRNEALANSLYRLAGVEVPDVRLIQFRGRTAVASRIVDGLSVDREALIAGRVAGVQEHFSVDAWLANWDVIGPDYANLKLGAGRGLRLDPGGALRFRAQGGMKGAAFGDEVLELQSMRNAGTNSHAASVFKWVTDADIEDGVRRILAIPEDAIAKAVEEFGPLDTAERKALLKKILARREYLAKKYPNAVPKAPAPLDTARVTAAEQKAIEASRANGYAIPTDSGAIEDHHVVISTYKDVNGVSHTRVVLKLREESGKRLESAFSPPQDVDLSAVKSKGLEMLRGINKRASTGAKLEPKDLDRYQEFKAEAKAALAKLDSGKFKDAKLRSSSRAAVTELLDAMDAYWKANRVTGAAVSVPTFDFARIAQRLELAIEGVEKQAIAWKKVSGLEYRVSNITKGYQVETTAMEQVPGVRQSLYADLGEGIEARYVTYDGGNTVTSKGYLQIDLPGVGHEVSARAFAELERMGVSATRSTADDRLELYLDRIAYVRTLRNAELTKNYAKLAGVTDRAERLKLKLELLNKDVGFDMRTSPNWRPDGDWQAFQHGRVLQYRPDFTEQEMRALDEGLAVYHNPTGLSWGASSEMYDRMLAILDNGGQLASQMDRIRRGIPARGSSVISDHQRGGANFIFTRLISRAENRRVGVYWKPRVVQRLDAFSYSTDQYGNVDRSLQEMDRAKTASDLLARRHGFTSSNETNFRDTLSLFDDLDVIVFKTRSERNDFIAELRKRGYSSWPDGRALEDVVTYVGSGK